MCLNNLLIVWKVSLTSNAYSTCLPIILNARTELAFSETYQYILTFMQKPTAALFNEEITLLRNYD